MIEELPLTPIGLVAMALIIAFQALQLLQGRKATNGEDALLLELRKTRTGLDKLVELEVTDHTKIKDLHNWHAPDAQGHQTWKGVRDLEEELRTHMDSDRDEHAEILRTIRQR